MYCWSFLTVNTTKRWFEVPLALSFSSAYFALRILLIFPLDSKLSTTIIGTLNSLAVFFVASYLDEHSLRSSFLKEQEVLETKDLLNETLDAIPDPILVT